MTGTFRWRVILASTIAPRIQTSNDDGWGSGNGGGSGGGGHGGGEASGFEVEQLEAHESPVLELNGLLQLRGLLLLL